MTRDDIVRMLRLDPGQRTLGQLLQDRERAAHEIDRLRAQIDASISSADRVARTPARSVVPKLSGSDAPLSFRPGTLIRLTQVCELLGISRSTIYKRLSDGTFPAPIRIGPGTVRWSVDALQSWIDDRASPV